MSKKHQQGAESEKQDEKKKVFPDMRCKKCSGVLVHFVFYIFMFLEENFQYLKY